MGVKVNHDVWNSIFAVPASVVDDHIKFAGGQQLKALLYILRHNNENVEIPQISKGTGMSESDVKDALQYWIEVGILSTDESQPARNAEMQKTNEAQKMQAIQGIHEIQVNTAPSAKVDLRELPDITPTYEQVAARTLESPEIKALFNEVQMKLGKTVGYSIQAKLLMIYDHYGLPVEVILTIVEYAVSHGKSSIKYIESVAKDWAEKGVNTLEAADKHIKKLQATEKLWKQFVSMFSVDPPKYTEKRISYLKKWHYEYKQSLELIYYACEETVNRINKVRFEYMDTMLENWYKQKLKTPVDVMQAEKEFSAKAEPGKGTASTNSRSAVSYDSDKFKKKAQAPIEYKRRNTNAQ